MPSERFPPDDPREWLNRARSNLAQAKMLLPGVYLEDLCFNAQQAAEKALKALLLQCRGCFPYTHDLGELLRLLGKAGQQIPAVVGSAGQLTEYGAEARYPGLSEPVTPEEHQEALAIAEAVVNWAEEALR